MECRVNIWLTMECNADAKHAAEDIDKKMKEAWEKKVPYSFWGVEFDYQNGWIEYNGDEATLSAMTTRDITADDAITLYVFFAHMEHAKRFVMEVEDDERFFYAIFSNEHGKLIMEYLPREHYPEDAIEEGYGVDIDILMDALDHHKVTKVLATDDGYTVRKVR